MTFISRPIYEIIVLIYFLRTRDLLQNGFFILFPAREHGMYFLESTKCYDIKLKKLLPY